MFPGVLEMPLQFIFVTSLSNKCYSYHSWLLVITKSGKKRKKSNKFNRFQIEVFFLPNISPLLYKLPKYRLIKFLLCPYICPGHINRILWYLPWLCAFGDFFSDIYLGVFFLQNILSGVICLFYFSNIE